MTLIPRRKLLLAAPALLLARRAVAQQDIPLIGAGIPPGSKFNPTSLITTGGGFWRADKGVTGGASPTQWNDQSTLGNNLTLQSGSSPSFSATGFNSSFPGITFTSGSTNRLATLSTGSSTVFPATTTVSCFWLFSTGSTLNTGDRWVWMIDTPTASDSTTPSFTTTDQGVVQSSTGLGNGGTAFSLSANTKYLLGFVLDGTHANKWLNGAVLGTATSFSSTVGGSSEYLGFGSNGGLGGPAGAATVAFFGITQHVMVTSDWTNLKTWSNSNWGTSF